MVNFDERGKQKNSLSGPLDTRFREGLDIPGYFDYTIVPERSELF